ncbi:hypothetical protein DWUX_1228 [Desulfovibrio diazotrophicus]|nr:hypothetical protein DWUX_1228 [Desulfovibrio diazotrophicus]
MDGNKVIILFCYMYNVVVKKITSNCAGQKGSMLTAANSQGRAAPMRLRADGR